nr:hypothetical protein [Tanacetum cinerariifolium]
MRPFGCAVTILNILDPLGKFNRKVDEGFLVRYSNTDDNAAFGGEKPKFEGRKPESDIHVSTSSKFEDFFDNSINEVNATDTPVLADGQILTNSTNTFSVNGPSNTVVSPTHGKSLYMNTSQYPDDPNMLELEDITYFDDEEDVGAEADFTNLETTITVSHIPTTRVHKDHHVTQIIGDLSSTTQTRSMTKVAKDQGGLSQINNDDFHTYRKSASTPIDTKKPLLKDPDDVVYLRLEAPPRRYSRPLLMKCSNGITRRPRLSVCACARFQVTPKVSHLHAVKRIFKYLKGKPHLGLWYPKDSPFNLVAYSDSDYAGASLNRKSTTGGCQFLGCKLIFWQCKKETVVATSSTEAKYVAAASCCAQVLWI